MDKLLNTFLSIKDLKFRVDDDFTDRLNRQVTATLFCLFAIMVSARQYLDDPIHCWCPESCASNHETYANIFCWVSDVYYVTDDDRMPQQNDRKEMISYYQWVPIILVFQALLFIFPCMLWRFLNKRSGINVAVIIETAVSVKKEGFGADRDQVIRRSVQMIDYYLMAVGGRRKRGMLATIRNCLSKHCMFMCSRSLGNYLTACYIFVKLVYLINACAQLFLLDYLLGYDYHLFGLQVMSHMMFGTEWTPSAKFPKTTLCDFHIRQNTNVHRYTYQCVLPINIFNEKIFVFVWFWLLAVALANFFSLVHWILKLCFWQNQYHFVKRRIKKDSTMRKDKDTVRRFVDNYLKRDGVFILRMIAKNTGKLITMDIFSALLEFYIPKQYCLEDAAAKPNGKGMKDHTPGLSRRMVVETV